MDGGAVDAEIRRRLAGGLNLGPDARIVRLERTIGQIGVVAADSLVKDLAPLRRHRIGFIVDPFMVGAEFAAPAQIDGEVDAQALGPGRRIDQSAEGRPPRHGKIAAPGEIARRDMLRLKTVYPASQGLRTQPRRIDHRAHGDVCRLACLVPRRDEETAAGLGTDHLHSRVEGEGAAGRFRIALEADHQCVAVNDACGWGPDGRHTGQGGFHRAGLLAAQQLQVGHAITGGLVDDALEGLDFARVACHDEFTRVAVWDPAIGAIGVEPVFSGDTAPCFQAILWIIDAGVDDFAVARAGFPANARMALNDEHALARQCKAPCRGESDDAGADNQYVKIVDHAP